MMKTFVNSSSPKTITSSNEASNIETKNINDINTDDKYREVVKKGYLLSNLDLKSVPAVIQNAIEVAKLDARDLALADEILQDIKDRLETMEDGIYTRSYIDNQVSYLEQIIHQKASPEIAASIAESKVAIATENLASTATVNILTSRVESSESQITQLNETINTKDLARASQINELKASIDESLATYSEVIDLTVDETTGEAKSSKIEDLRLSIESNLNTLFMDVDILKRQNDGVVETVSGDYDVLDVNNNLIATAEPYASWIAEDTANGNFEQRALHIGDVYVKLDIDEDGVSSYNSAYKFVKKEPDNLSPDKTDTEGFTWSKIVDTAVQEALSKAILAQTTADGKINTYYGTLSEMYAMSNSWDEEQKFNNKGDIFYASTNNDKPYRWNGAAWMIVDDKKIGDLEVSITETNELIATKDGEWKAQSTKFITAPDGSITGYSFIDGSGLTSNFTINADSFKISDSTNSYTPFSIIDNKIAFNGLVTFSNTISDTDGRTIQEYIDDLNSTINTKDSERLLDIAQLDGKIDTKEQELINSINLETQNRIDAIAQRVQEEARLDGKITTAEQNRIDAINNVSNAYQNYVSVVAKSMADGILTQEEEDLISEAAANVNLAKQRFLDIENDVSSIIADVSNLQTDLTAKTLEIAQLDGKIDTKEQELIADIQAEQQQRISDIAARINADALLDGKIDSEEQNRIDAINNLSDAYKNYISVVTKAIADGVLTAEEQELISNAQAEVNLAKQRFLDIENDVNSILTDVSSLNTSVSQQAIELSSLDGKIDSEEAARINAINAEQTARAADIQARIDEEARLDGLISAEEQARIDSANALTLAYQNYTDTVKQALIDGEITQAEQNAIIEAQNRVNAAKTQLETQINNLTKVEDISWQTEVKNAIENNTATIDGNKIIAPIAWVNQLNALGGINADSISANTVSASNIVTGSITLDKLDVSSINLNSLTGTINWGNIDGKPDLSNFITSSYEGFTYIDAYGVYTGNVSANQITTGTLNASNITVTNLTASSISTGTLSVDRIPTLSTTYSTSSTSTLTYNSSYTTALSKSIYKTYASYTISGSINFPSRTNNLGSTVGLYSGSTLLFEFSFPSIGTNSFTFSSTGYLGIVYLKVKNNESANATATSRQLSVVCNLK